MVLQRLSVCGLLSLLLQACALPFSGNGGTASQNSQSSLSADPALQSQALSILTNKCIACHGPGMQDGGVSDITNVNSLISQGLIVPGSITQGRLLPEIQSGAMPPSGGALSADDIGMIKDWIDSFKVAATPTPAPKPSPTPVAGGTSPTYTSIRATILNRCTSCHGEFGTYSSLMSSGVVVAGNAASSSLYKKTASASMPPSSSGKLSTSELSALQSWINAGALNN